MVRPNVFGHVKDKPLSAKIAKRFSDPQLQFFAVMHSHPLSAPRPS